MSEYSEDMHDELHDAITRELGKFISSKAATFACGGSITIVSDTRFLNTYLTY